MKLKFKNQDFQTDAMNAVVDLFTGQENAQYLFCGGRETDIAHE